MEKVLFLDIDGVVNCKTTMQRHRGFIGIDPFMAFLVGRIVDKTQCKVVLSSTWRLWEESRNEVIRQVCKIHDVTPSLNGSVRGEEIKAWLDKNNVDRYAILDDDSDMLKEQLECFFQTSWNEGLTEDIAERVIEHLTIK